MSIVAYATSPTALAAMDSTAFANAPILRSLRNAEEEYSENIPAAFERIGSLAAKRKAERLAFLQAVECYHGGKIIIEANIRRVQITSASTYQIACYASILFRPHHLSVIRHQHLCHIPGSFIRFGCGFPTKCFPPDSVQRRERPYSFPPVVPPLIRKRQWQE